MQLDELSVPTCLNRIALDSDSRVLLSEMTDTGIESMFLLISQLVRWVLVSHLSAISHAENGWTVSRVLQLLDGREQSVEKMEALVEVSQPIPEGHRKYFEARQLSLRLRDESRGVPSARQQSYESRKYQSSPSYRIRYLRGSAGLQRFDRLTVSGASPSQLTVSFRYDGQHWWSLRGKEAIMNDGKAVPRDGRFLGLDFNWGVFGSEPASSHSLAGALRELHALGIVRIVHPQPGGLVAVLVRHGARTGHPEEAGLLVQHILHFDPNKGLALVSYESRTGGMKGEEFIDLHPPMWWQGAYDAFKEVSEGIWLPMTFREESYKSVHFPKLGQTYPRGFDFAKASYLDFRVESFPFAEVKARIIDLKFNQELAIDAFKPVLSKDVTLHDQIHDKVYQNSDLIPAGMASELRHSEIKTRGSGLGVWIWMIVANAMLIGACAVLVRLRRRREILRQAKGQPTRACGQ